MRPFYRKRVFQRIHCNKSVENLGKGQYPITYVNMMIFQYIKFGLVGISNTLIGLAVYYFCLYVLHLFPQLCNLFGFIISVLNAYHWNLRWVFKTNGSKNTLLKFFSIYFFTYLLSAGLLYLWVGILQISAMIAPLLSLCITVPTNFFLSKFWAFKERKSN